jgi:hypothetical protein
MMVRELTDVVQSYPNRGKRAPEWLVEGIADYIKSYKYKRGACHSRIDPVKATYHDSYRTSGPFLDYLVRRPTSSKRGRSSGMPQAARSTSSPISRCPGARRDA